MNDNQIMVVLFSGAVGTLNPGQNLHSFAYRYHSCINDKPSGNIISDDICTVRMCYSLHGFSVLLAIHMYLVNLCLFYGIVCYLYAVCTCYIVVILGGNYLKSFSYRLLSTR